MSLVTSAAPLFRTKSFMLRHRFWLMWKYDQSFCSIFHILIASIVRNDLSTKCIHVLLSRNNILFELLSCIWTGVCFNFLLLLLVYYMLTRLFYCPGNSEKTRNKTRLQLGKFMYFFTYFPPDMKNIVYVLFPAKQLHTTAVFFSVCWRLMEELVNSYIESQHFCFITDLDNAACST